MTRVAGLSLALISTLPFACSGSSSDYGDAPNGSGTQVSFDMALSVPRPEFTVVVLDDQPGTMVLRETVGLRFESYASRIVYGQPPCGHTDPARPRLVDQSLIVVHPSASGDARFVSAVDDPRLRWQEPNASEAGRLAWVTALNEALLQTHEEAPFAPLSALHSISQLLGGARTAETAAEGALLEAVPKNSVLRLVLLAAGEDQSSGEPSDYVVTLPSDASLETLVLPSAEPVDPVPTCGPLGATTPRFEAWQRAQQRPPNALWPCNALPLLDPPTVDCEPRCVGWRALQEDDGRATCRIQVDAAVDACDEARGWLDPIGEDGLRHPVRRSTSAGAVSTCEIRQLTGAGLESCRSTLACSGCEPGWCATEVRDLLDECLSGPALPFRFVGGSDSVASGTATVLCNAERLTPQ